MKICEFILKWCVALSEFNVSAIIKKFSYYKLGMYVGPSIQANSTYHMGIRPDTTVMVDWALKTNNQSINMGTQEAGSVPSVLYSRSGGRKVWQQKEG